MNSDEEKLEQTVEQFAELAKQDKNIDVAALMMSALQKDDENKISGRTRKWSYLISLFVPPFGLLPAIKYYFFDDHIDAKEVALVCLLLTAISVFGTIIFMKVLFSTAGVTPAQIEQITPGDIMQLTQ